MLNPIFSADNMRHMTPTFYKIAEKVWVLDVRDGSAHADTICLAPSRAPSRHWRSVAYNSGC